MKVESNIPKALARLAHQIVAGSLDLVEEKEDKYSMGLMHIYNIGVGKKGEIRSLTAIVSEVSKEPPSKNNGWWAGPPDFSIYPMRFRILYRDGIPCGISSMEPEENFLEGVDKIYYPVDTDPYPGEGSPIILN